MMIQGKFDEISPEYAAFLDKFKPKKTTDDCYTPAPVYDAVAGYVARRFGRDPAAFVRPFWPGADYQREEYPQGCTVVDNPPFSIISNIVEWFQDRRVPFFLFCPYQINLGIARRTVGVTHTIAPHSVRYENGAEVATSFIHNLSPGIVAEAEPYLAALVAEADAVGREKQRKNLPKYSYPDNIATSTGLGYLAVHGVPLTIRAESALVVGGLDAQKAMGKSIFGCGLLLSTRAAAERAAAERAAAERAAAERAAAERAAAHRLQLSEREREMVAWLDSREAETTETAPQRPADAPETVAPHIHATDTPNAAQRTAGQAVSETAQTR